MISICQILKPMPNEGFLRKNLMLVYRCYRIKLTNKESNLCSLLHRLRDFDKIFNIESFSFLCFIDSTVLICQRNEKKDVSISRCKLYHDCNSENQFKNCTCTHNKMYLCSGSSSSAIVMFRAEL